MANRKQQHYVPKATLRRFAVDWANTKRPKQINLVNLKSGKTVRGASLADQCYRDYYYGKDLVFESLLGQLEGVFADLTRKMIDTRSIDERDGWSLVQMISLQKARTLRAGDELNSMAEKMIRLLMHNRVEEKILRSVRIGVKDAPNQNIATSFKLSPLLLDLKRFLIVNQTATPFILSDNPVVATNWFGRLKAPDRMSGTGRAGLQLFMPISPEFALFFHDPNVYTADAANSVIQLRRREDAIALNELQWLNAYENVYFPPSLAQLDLDAMTAVRRGSPKLANFTRAERSNNCDAWSETDKDEFAKPTEGVKSELVMVSALSLPKDIRIQGLRIKTKPRYHDDGSMGSFIRDPIWERIVRDFADAVTKQWASPSKFWDFVAQHPEESRVGPWLQRLARRSARQRHRQSSEGE